MIARIARNLIRRIPIVVFLLVVAEIFVTNELAGLGRSVRLYEADIEKLAEENQLLREQIASSSSLIALVVKAKEQGLHEPTSNQFITLVPEQLPVALVQPR